MRSRPQRHQPAPQPSLQPVVESTTQSVLRSNEVVIEMTPQPVIESVAPQPVIESVAPQPVIESIAPQPVIESIAPQPVIESVAPQPVQGAVQSVVQLVDEVRQPVIEVQTPVKQKNISFELKDVIFEKTPFDFHFRKYVSPEQAVRTFKQFTNDFDIVKYFYTNFAVSSYISLNGNLWTVVYDKDRVMHIEKRMGNDMVTYKYDGIGEPEIVRIKRY